MDGPKGAIVTVTVEGENLSKKIELDGPKLYTLVHADSFKRGEVLTLTAPKGVTVNAFTFGG